MRRQETPRAARSVGVRSWVAPVLAQRGTIFSVNAAYPLFFPRPVSSSLVIARYSRPTLSQQAWFTLLVGIGRNVGGCRRVHVVLVKISPSGVITAGSLMNSLSKETDDIGLRAPVAESIANTVRTPEYPDT